MNKAAHEIEIKKGVYDNIEKFSTEVLDASIGAPEFTFEQLYTKKKEEIEATLSKTKRRNPQQQQGMTAF